MKRQQDLRRRGSVAAVICLVVVGVLGVDPAEARLFKRTPVAEESRLRLDAVLAAIDQALAEQRLVDAGRLLDSTLAQGVQDKRLLLRAGELHLARQRYEDAIRSFTEAETAVPQEKALAFQGRGIALAALGRTEDAGAALAEAVKLDPSLWRAWNALAVERDRRRDWTGAEAAYAQALKAPGVTPVVYNNRGYSRLLQGRHEEASADFIKALEMDPAFAVARTNLRLSLALRGEYYRASSVSGTEDRASVLNNAGFAALVRGDLGDAERLFQQAVEARGSSYGRAVENLNMVRVMQKSSSTGAKP